PSFETRAEIARLVAARETQGPWPRDPDGAPLYPGQANVMPDSERKRRMGDGEPYALRLDMRAAVARAGRLSWGETGAAPAGATGRGGVEARASRGRHGALCCGSRRVGRRDPGAQGNANQLSPRGGDR